MNFNYLFKFEAYRNMKRQLIITLLAMIPSIHLFGQNTYYVSTTGNNNSNGTFEQPWQTIDYAVGQLFPGDTLEIREGTYHEIVDGFIRSGNAGNVITIRNYRQEHVLINSNDAHTVIYFHDQSYYHFNGLELTGGVWSGFGGVCYHHTRVSGCTIHDIGPSSGTSVGIYISAGPGSPDSSTHNTIEYNTIYNIHGEGIYVGDNAYKTPPDGSPCNHNLIQFNDISQCGDGIDIKSGSKYNKVYGNRIHHLNSGEHNAGILLFEDTIVDSNYIYDNSNYAIYNQGNRNTICRNMIYGNNRYTIIISACLDMWNNYKNAGDDNFILNNTIVDNNGYGIWIWAGEGQEAENNVIKNNIFANNTGYQVYTYPHARFGIEMDGNDYIAASDPLIRYDGEDYYTIESFQQSTVHGDHSLSVDPEFVDAMNHDYTLQSSSPMIDQGLDVGFPFYGDAQDIGAFEFLPEEDMVPPNSPSNLTSPSQTDSTIELRWNQPDPAADGDTAVYYNVYRDSEMIGNTSTNTFIDSGLNENTLYFYQIYSVDDDSNECIEPAEGNFQTTEFLDNTPPNPPKNLTSPNQTSNSITLLWNSPDIASDGDYPSYYKICRNNVEAGTTYDTTFVDVDLIDHMPYSYQIYSVDENDNVSILAAEGTFQTLVNYYPTPNPVDESLFATIEVGQPSRWNKNIPILLTTSKNVIQVPTPVILIEEDLSTTYIEITGKIPGNTFKGKIELNENIANGSGYFQLNEGTLIDSEGKIGNTEVKGDTIIIDKIPPIIPSRIQIKLTN